MDDMLRSHWYHLTEGPRVQDPTGAHILQCNRWKWDIIVYRICSHCKSPCLSPWKVPWLIPVHTGLSCHFPSAGLPLSWSVGGLHRAGWCVHSRLLKDTEKRSDSKADPRVVFKCPCLCGNALKLSMFSLAEVPPIRCNCFLPFQELLYVCILYNNRAWRSQQKFCFSESSH